jgi:hypothetical protein
LPKRRYISEDVLSDEHFNCISDGAQSFWYRLLAISDDYGFVPMDPFKMQKLTCLSEKKTRSIGAEGAGKECEVNHRQEPAKEEVMPAIVTGIGLIASERQRQVTDLGWDDLHDQEHTEGELAIVAAIYAVQGLKGIRVLQYCRTVSAPKIDGLETESNDRVFAGIEAWPKTWHEDHDSRNRGTRVRKLAKAGALIAAEIDRIICEL